MRADRAFGYSAPMPPATVFALAEPDAEPLPRPTRSALVWQDAEWAEIDVETGAILCRGTTADEPANKARLP